MNSAHPIAGGGQSARIVHSLGGLRQRQDADFSMLETGATFMVAQQIMQAANVRHGLCLWQHDRGQAVGHRRGDFFSGPFMQRINPHESADVRRLQFRDLTLQIPHRLSFKFRRDRVLNVEHGGARRNPDRFTNPVAAMRWDEQRGTDGPHGVRLLIVETGHAQARGGTPSITPLARNRDGLRLPGLSDCCHARTAARARRKPMPYPTHLLPTTVVGSYPQPIRLGDGVALKQHGVPRVHAHGIWRVPEALLEQAQDDGTILAIREMERAGIDIVTDGEIRRESYSNRFALALEGVDADHPGEVRSQAGRATPVPRVVGKIRRRGPVELRDTEFLLQNATHATKITLPGPFTLTQQARNEFYQDEAELAMDYAVAVNEELRALKASGVDVVQLDESWVRTAPEKAARYGLLAINRALEGIEGPTVVHLCFGYAAVVADKPSGYSFLPQLADTIADQISIEAAQPNLDLGVLRDLAGKKIMLGVIDLGDLTVESAETIASRIRAALKYVAPENLIPAPDCGMKYLPRGTAFGKLKALADGAAIVRRELTGYGAGLELRTQYTSPSRR